MRSPTAAGPRQAAASLRVLAEQLRDERSVISPHVREPDRPAALGNLAAAGPRAAAAPAEYALVVESVREGYLLHYSDPRVVVGAEPDLALLAGDYLYARGLERLAALGDPEAVHELADLISLSAQVHVRAAPTEAPALWLASATALAAGATEEHESAKAELREGRRGAPHRLAAGAVATASAAGLEAELRAAAEAVGFPSPELTDLG